MSDEHVVLAVGAYGSSAAARRDFETIRCGPPAAAVDVATAIVGKGADGWLRLERYDDAAGELPWAGKLLGAALTVVAVPLGILFFVPFMTATTAWAGIAALVGQLWHHIPRDELRQMGVLLEAGQAGLVVVAIDRTADEVRGLLPGATTAVVTESIAADFRAEYSTAIEEAAGGAPPRDLRRSS